VTVAGTRLEARPLLTGPERAQVAYTGTDLVPAILPESTSAATERNLNYDFGPLADLIDLDALFAPAPMPQPFPWASEVQLNPKVVSDADKWRVSNESFIYGIDSTRSLQDADIIESQTLFMAMLSESTFDNEKQRAHPIWSALRNVDQRVFGNWKSKAQRIAMMFVCHRMLLVRSILPTFPIRTLTISSI
jgi:hypothetical protein